MYKLQQISYKFFKKVGNIFCLRHLKLLANIISVIVMKYNIKYREICYLLNRCRHKAVCAVQANPLTAAQYSSEYLFIMLMFTPIKSQSSYSRIFYIPFSSSSLCEFFNPYSIQSATVMQINRQTAKH